VTRFDISGIDELLDQAQIAWREPSFLYLHSTIPGILDAFLIVQP
jgi:uncharacterized Rmd1/YagE family protein